MKISVCLLFCFLLSSPGLAGQYVLKSEKVTSSNIEGGKLKHVVLSFGEGKDQEGQDNGYFTVSFTFERGEQRYRDRISFALPDEKLKSLKETGSLSHSASDEFLDTITGVHKYVTSITYEEGILTAKTTEKVSADGKQYRVIKSVVRIKAAQLLAEEARLNLQEIDISKTVAEDQPSKGVVLDIRGGTVASPFNPAHHSD